MKRASRTLDAALWGVTPRLDELCMMTFQHEYDDVWVDLMSKLERWIVENDAELEATRIFRCGTDERGIETSLLSRRRNRIGAFPPLAASIASLTGVDWACGLGRGIAGSGALLPRPYAMPLNIGRHGFQVSDSKPISPPHHVSPTTFPSTAAADKLSRPRKHTPLKLARHGDNRRLARARDFVAGDHAVADRRPVAKATP